MKRYLILLFVLTLMLLTACSFRQANAEEPDKSGSDVQQGEPSREQEQETDSAALSALRQEAAGANCPCAIACPNFETDETTFPAIRDALREAYPVLEDAVCVDAGGEEYFVIVPTDPTASTAVYRCELSDAGEMVAESAPLETVSDGAIVLLRCNESDIIPNTLVRITNGDGTTFEFSPFLSLRDGRIGTEGVYDFTAYPPDMPPEE